MAETDGIDGIKYNCKKQFNGKVRAQHKLYDLTSKMLEHLYKQRDQTGIWLLLETVKYSFYLDSEIIGEYTRIKPYTNRRGKTHMAHYTINDKYYGSTENLGNKPVSYKGYFPLIFVKPVVSIDFDLEYTSIESVLKPKAQPVTQSNP